MIYGFKGLEWDVVVVVRFVVDEFFSWVFDIFGWFGFGVVFFVLCGDCVVFLCFIWDLVVVMGEEVDLVKC